jgi:hypothetical protein
MAQVFSVNAVGYVNKTIPAGQFMMISNPLNAATNTIDALFAGVPNGFQVYKYTPGTGYTIGTYDDLDGSFGPLGSQDLLPGQGVFVRNPTTSDVTITFVGEVPQGNLSTPMVAGLQMVSSQVPQAGNTTDLNFPDSTADGLSNGDQVYKFVNGVYDIATFDDLDDKFDKNFTLDVGEAVFVKLGKAVNWTRDFNVNQ